MTDRELMQQALDALIDAADSQSWELQQNIDQHGDWYRSSRYLKEEVAKSQEAIEALRARLAQPEPDDGYCQACEGNHCTAKNGCVARDNPPPQREWKGLTLEEIKKIEMSASSKLSAIYLTEAQLKGKNA